MKKRVRRILVRKNAANSIRPSDVFIVTYPKSGTVWLSFLIANILKSDQSETLNLKSFLKYVPDINDPYFAGGHWEEFSSLPDPRFFYVHAPYDPSFPKVVYVLRDPRDVMVSYFHHRRMTDERFCYSMQEFISSDKHFPCRWDKHVAGWLLDNRHPHLHLVRYEEMHRDIQGTLRRVLDFVGLRYTEADVLQAVEASRFERMRSVEEKFGLAGPEVLSNTDERFVRKGKIGSWRDELNEESVRILEQKYGAVMRKVGYEPGN